MKPRALLVTKTPIVNRQKTSGNAFLVTKTPTVNGQISSESGLLVTKTPLVNRPKNSELGYNFRGGTPVTFLLNELRSISEIVFQFSFITVYIVP